VQLPLFWASGYSHLATSVTVVFMNAAAAVVTLVLLYRFSSTISLPAAFAASVAVFLVRVPDLLANPWNPLAVILLLPLIMTLSALVITGQAAWMPLLIFLASLAVQAHVGFAAPVLAIAGSAAAGLVITAVRGDAAERRAAARWFAAALAVGVLVWAPPLWDAISPAGSHNLQKLWAFFRSATAENANLGIAAFTRFVVVPFAPTLQVPGGQPVGTWFASPTLAATQTVLLVVAALVFHLRGRRFEAIWSWVLLVTVALSFASVLRIPEVPLNHTVFWVSILGVMTWASIAACLADLVAPVHRTGGGKRHALRIAAAVCFLVLVAAGMQQARARARSDGAPIVRTLAVPIRTELMRHGTRTARLEVSSENWNEVAGVALVLMKQGYDISVPPDWVWMFGPSMAGGADPSRTFFFKHSASDVVPEHFELLATVSTVPVYVKRR
jgi:hypothetical protein